LALDADIQEVFNTKNFPKNPAPRILDIAKKNLSGTGNKVSL
jgi:hypothetical protein